MHNRSLLLRRFVFRKAEANDWWWTARDHGKGTHGFPSSFARAFSSRERRLGTRQSQPFECVYLLKLAYIHWLTSLFFMFFFWGGGGGYSNNLLIHLIKFCFVFVCLIVSCFLKRILHFFVSLGHNLFFRRQSITKVNIKKSKQQNSEHVSNALIWLLKLLLCFVVLLFLIIILSVIYWPQKKKNPSITDVSSKFLQFIYRCMLASAKF